MNPGFLLTAYYLINIFFNDINDLHECMHLFGRLFSELPCQFVTVDCFGLKLKAWL